jgi:hypothetical protein
LWELDAFGKIILKLILKKEDVKLWITFYWDRMRTVVNTVMNL